MIEISDAARDLASAIKASPARVTFTRTGCPQEAVPRREAAEIK
jgi:hypothetical protein